MDSWVWPPTCPPADPEGNPLLARYIAQLPLSCEYQTQKGVCMYTASVGPPFEVGNIVVANWSVPGADAECPPARDFAGVTRYPGNTSAQPEPSPSSVPANSSSTTPPLSPSPSTDASQSRASLPVSSEASLPAASSSTPAPTFTFLSSNNAASSQPRPPIGAIAGGVVAGIALLAAILACRRKRIRNRRTANSTGVIPAPHFVSSSRASFDPYSLLPDTASTIAHSDDAPPPSYALAHSPVGGGAGDVKGNSPGATGGWPEEKSPARVREMERELQFAYQ
ncbi:hypothetical protein MIND_01427800 [Mycena indigotica]|uniref:Uncharacterized protein n=1 Tax=Mycena indigotica TaxID=2126181 RepID=A0A8H6RYI0_9AGAR|nr:uncharacterized protein MIND_01427800 [Mycena indigotica]KAF7288612.1 hypothetical protein MIND_01427800 [Mycena indigotica]